MSFSVVQDNEKLTPKVSNQVKDVALLSYIAKLKPCYILKIKSSILGKKCDKIVDKKWQNLENSLP